MLSSPPPTSPVKGEANTRTMNFIYLIPALPFAGFLILALMGRRLAKPAIAVIGAGSVGLSAICTILIGIEFITSPPTEHAFTRTLWTWMQFDGYAPTVSFLLDP